MNKSQNSGFSAAEKEAMKARARELKLQEKFGNDKAKGEKDVLATIDKLNGSDRQMAEQLHKIVSETAPDLLPKTMYGMPGYANREGKNILFFQAAQKFGTRHASLGFSDLAKLDDGNMWPSSFGIIKIGPAEEKKIKALIKKALG
ncbi:MAG: DUF1801 domain-containing protein [Anaerolineales bacterium]|nr:DUF1801 domain-containing protein [Anaerolineales bacterium]